MEEIYELDNGQMYTYGHIKLSILRVPGGWVYSWYRRFLFWRVTTATTFIPFDEEFLEIKNDKRIGFKK
jgi:hypothetical protein